MENDWDATLVGQSGHLLLWSAEQTALERQRAESEKQRANPLATKLRELGVDPDSLQQP